MKKTLLKTVALCAAISFFSANTIFAAGGSIAVGDVSVYKEGKLISKLSGQNPIEDGSLLICDGNCMVKSEGITLVGEKNAQLATSSEPDTFRLYVKEGKVNFVVTNNVRKISFHTPQGSYTIAEVIFNADSNSAVKGSVVVTEDGKTEISVTEGRLVFATAEGMKAVDANQKIILAVAPGAAAGAGAGAAAGAGAGTALLFSGGMLVAYGTLAAAVNSSDDGPTATPAPPAATPAPPITPPATTPASPSL